MSEQEIVKWLEKPWKEFIEKLWILPVFVILFILIYWYFFIRDRQDEFGSL